MALEERLAVAMEEKAREARQLFGQSPSPMQAAVEPHAIEESEDEDEQLDYDQTMGVDEVSKDPEESSEIDSWHCQ